MSLACRFGVHADRADAGTTRVTCRRCGRTRVRWGAPADGDVEPACPPALACSEAHGGSFIALRLGRARGGAVRGAAWIAGGVTVLAWALIGDPAFVQRVAGIGLAAIGVSILYVTFADALGHVVIELDADALTVRPASRFAPVVTLDASSIEGFEAGTRGSRAVLHVRQPSRAVPLVGLPVRSFADAVFVAARLSSARSRLSAAVHRTNA